MTRQTSPDLLDLAEAVAAGELRADDAERQVRAALGPGQDAASDAAVRELRGLTGAVGAVRSHVRATHEASTAGSQDLAQANGSIATIVPGPVRVIGPRSRPSRGRNTRGARRTWLLVAATIAIGAGIVGASLAGSRLMTPVPVPTTPVAVADASAAPEGNQDPTAVPSPVPSDASPVVVPRSPGWSAGAPMVEARKGHTTTLLQDGRVLVTGGDNANGTSAEMYDPRTGSWTATGSTATPVANGTATLLSDGRVLVTGGVTLDAAAPNGWRLVAQLYDPASGSWTVAEGMASGGATATLLPDGRVLLLGGGNDGLAVELYDPASGSWTTGGSAPIPVGPVALLRDGRVLVAGTRCAGQVHFDCPRESVVELYDPGAGTWRPTGSMVTPCESDTTTLLLDGRVLVTCTTGANDANPVTTVQLYDPASGSWTATGTMATARSQFTATPLADGKVLVTGGIGKAYKLLASAELYDPATGTWTAAGGMAAPRYAGTATLLRDGVVLLAGGMGAGDVPLASTELYDPGTGTTPNAVLPPSPRPVSPTPSPALAAGPTPTPVAVSSTGPGAPAWTLTGDMIIKRAVRNATVLPDGRVLVVGGAGYIGAPLADAELYDPTSGTWSATGSMGTPRDGPTATRLRDGRVLVVGGSGSGGKLATAEIYAPATGTWTATGKMHTPRAGNTATLLPDGRVLVAGGMGTSTSTGPDLLASAELYDPASGSWTPAGRMLTARSESSAVLLPDGTVLVVGGVTDQEAGSAAAELFDPRRGTWTATRNLVYRRTTQTATLLQDGTVLVAGGSGSTAETYDPRSGSWTATGSMGTTRDADLMAALLPDGRALAVGGDYNSGGNGTTAEVYDPTSGTWTATPPMPIAGSTTTLLLDGTVLVAGQGGGWSPPGSAELYHPGNGG